MARRLEDLGDLHRVLLVHRTHRVAQRPPGVASRRRLELPLGLLLAIRGSLLLALPLRSLRDQGGELGQAGQLLLQLLDSRAAQLLLQRLNARLHRLHHILRGRHFKVGGVKHYNLVSNYWLLGCRPIQFFFALDFLALITAYTGPIIRLYFNLLKKLK